MAQDSPTETRDFPLDNECTSCAEEAGGAVGVHRDECFHSKRNCGHHCNHSWSEEHCCWCGKEFGEEDLSDA